MYKFIRVSTIIVVFGSAALFFIFTFVTLIGREALSEPIGDFQYYINLFAYLALGWLSLLVVIRIIVKDKRAIIAGIILFTAGFVYSVIYRVNYSPGFPNITEFTNLAFYGFPALLIFLTGYLNPEKKIEANPIPSQPGVMK